VHDTTTLVRSSEHAAEHAARRPLRIVTTPERPQYWSRARRLAWQRHHHDLTTPTVRGGSAPSAA
jgi:hypothetical protein